MDKVVEHRNPEVKWHRHPLLISLVSFLLAGVVLHFVQTNTIQSRQLREKRMSILEDIVHFSSLSASVYRSLNGTAQIIGHPRFNELTDVEKQNRMQDQIDNAYQLAHKLELELAVYFPSTSSYDQFFELRKFYQNNVQSAIKKLRNLEEPIELISIQDYNNLKHRINIVIQTLINSVEIPGLEKHPIFSNNEVKLGAGAE